MNLKENSMIYSHFVIPKGVKGSEKCFDFDFGFKVLLCCVLSVFLPFIFIIQKFNNFHLHSHFSSDDDRKPPQPVQMVQYSDSTKSPPVTTTLKSLHDPYDDNLSFASSSQSPTSGIVRGSLTKLNAPTYYRPNPPAYRAPKTGEGSGMMFHHQRGEM